MFFYFVFQSFLNQINQVKEYLRYRKVPMKTQRRVLNYYEHRYQRKYFNEKSILQEQSHPIRRVITIECIYSFCVNVFIVYGNYLYKLYRPMKSLDAKTDTFLPIWDIGD